MRGVDEPGPDGRGLCPGEPAVGDHAEGTGEVERDCGDREPGTVGVERFGRHMGQWACFEFGEDLLDRRVAAVGFLRLHQGAVWLVNTAW
mgnify:FL=1